MKVRDMEKLAMLLDEFKKVVPSRGEAIDTISTLVENEIFETKRRGKTETPKK